MLILQLGTNLNQIINNINNPNTNTLNNHSQPSLNEQLIQEQQAVHSNYAAEYLDHSLLDKFIPEDRKKRFTGMKTAELIQELPSLKLVFQEEKEKKLGRLTVDERKIYEEDQEAKLQKRPWGTLLQTVSDKQSSMGHFFQFIRMVEGDTVQLDLDMMFDSMRMKGWLEFVKRRTPSSKTHRNKAFHMKGVLRWLKTFSCFANHLAKIRACIKILKLFCNAAKMNAKSEMPAQYTEAELTEHGKFFGTKEMVTYFQWILAKWKAELAAFKESKSMKKKVAFKMQRYLITLMLGFSGGVRREVIGKLIKADLAYDSNDILFTYMAHEKVARQKTNRIPLPQMLKSFVEFFLQHVRPNLLVTPKDKLEPFDPDSLWVDAKGSAMQLRVLTKEVKRLSAKFNPSLSITPIQFRRMTLTEVFKGSISFDMEFEVFLSHLADYLNVDKVVMKEHYNRFSVLNQNVEVQKLLQESQLKEVTPGLEETNQLMDPLLEGNVISTVVPKQGRLVRTVLEDKKWEKVWKKHKKDKERKKRKAKKEKKKGPAKKKLKKEGDEYEVKKVLNKRCNGGQIEYKIKWKGYTRPTWEPLEGLGNALQAVNRYEISHY